MKLLLVTVTVLFCPFSISTAELQLPTPRRLPLRINVLWSITNEEPLPRKATRLLSENIHIVTVAEDCPIYRASESRVLRWKLASLSVTIVADSILHLHLLNLMPLMRTFWIDLISTNLALVQSKLVELTDVITKESRFEAIKSFLPRTRRPGWNSKVMLEGSETYSLYSPLVYCCSVRQGSPVSLPGHGLSGDGTMWNVTHITCWSAMMNKRKIIQLWRWSIFSNTKLGTAQTWTSDNFWLLYIYSYF